MSRHRDDEKYCLKSILRKYWLAILVVIAAYAALHWLVGSRKSNFQKLVELLSGN